MTEREDPRLTVGEVSAELGVTVRTLHHYAVMTRLDELSGLVRAIDHALEAEMNDTPATDRDLAEIFGTAFDDGYAAEAEQKWGDTDEWRQSQERTKNYTRTQWEQIKVESDAVEAQLLEAFRAGLPHTSVPALAGAEAHRSHMERWFYDCGSRMLRNLAHLYVQDHRFTAQYDETHHAPGFAAWVSQAMLEQADRLDEAT